MRAGLPINIRKTPKVAVVILEKHLLFEVTANISHICRVHPSHGHFQKYFTKDFDAHPPLGHFQKVRYEGL